MGRQDAAPSALATSVVAAIQRRGLIGGATIAYVGGVSPPPLPTIVEVKHTLAGAEKRFECRLLARTATHLAVLWVAPSAMHVHGVDLPAGTVSIGHFWTDRNYNVYHWLSSDHSTIGYYFNIADRTSWTAQRLDWRDLAVDVLAMPGGRLEVLDEDELPPDLPADARAHVDAGKAALLGATANVLAEVEVASRALLPLAFGGAP
jgi:hypothetical protein